MILGVSMLPDAEAAVILGEKLGLPVASLAVGSDVMVYPDRMPVLWKRLSDTLERVDLPMGVSQSICRTLTETSKCRREPLCVYLSGDTNAFSPTLDKAEVRRKLGWPADNIMALYVGGLVESKGMHELAEACEPLLRKHKGFSLVCVGEGPARAVVSGLREKVGREDAVSLPGRVGPDEVPLFLQGADFLVLPSHSEGMPQAVVEAMHCGLAVVATRVGGVPEAVVDGGTGLLVEARDVNQLRDAMERMIVDEAFRRTAAREGRERAHDMFDPERNARIFADALKSLVSAHCSGKPGHG